MEYVMQRIGCPRQLPGAEIRLPALLIQVGEDQEQQHRDQSRNHHHADDDAVHEAWRTLPAEIDRRLRRRLIPNVFTAWGANTTRFKDTAWTREYLESVTWI